jgi:phosphoglycolate phosphatase
MVRLVLFDIDGTLIRTGGAGLKAFERTFAEVFAMPEATKTLQFAGRTDTSLVRECFRLHGIEPHDEHLRRFFEYYPSVLAELLGTLPGAVLPGVERFMEELFATQNRPIVGLLTGNIRRGAELKLRHFNLWEKFETGAFADDSEDRDCIAATARKRAEEIARSSLHGDEIVVIGDTPLDVKCAQSIGAKCLAVATGIHSRGQLAESRPTWAVDHLEEISVREVLGR